MQAMKFQTLGGPGLLQFGIRIIFDRLKKVTGNTRC
jgi:hypothetical protein